jgi:Response regulator containing a CheY-like receiver domain and an HD-GYP domain
MPAIALTAYARAQDRIRAIAAGYNTHIAKPVEMSELVTVVKCLNGQNRQDYMIVRIIL